MLEATRFVIICYGSPGTLIQRARKALRRLFPHPNAGVRERVRLRAHSERRTHRLGGLLVFSHSEAAVGSSGTWGGQWVWSGRRHIPPYPVGLRCPLDILLVLDGAGRCLGASCSRQVTHCPSDTPSPCPVWEEPHRVSHGPSLEEPGSARRAPGMVWTEPAQRPQSPEAGPLLC